MNFAFFLIDFVNLLITQYSLGRSRALHLKNLRLKAEQFVTRGAKLVDDDENITQFANNLNYIPQMIHFVSKLTNLRVRALYPEEVKMINSQVTPDKTYDITKTWYELLDGNHRFYLYRHHM